MAISGASVTTGTLAHYPAVPIYYVVSRALTPEQIPLVRAALSITPVLGAVISNVMDAPLAMELADNAVVQCVSDEFAHAVAKEISQTHNQPVLVIGEAALLDAVFKDGRREAVTI